MTPWHFGSLHAYEVWGVVLIALAPFLLLGLLAWVRGSGEAGAAADEEVAEADRSQLDR